MLSSDRFLHQLQKSNVVQSPPSPVFFFFNVNHQCISNANWLLHIPVCGKRLKELPIAEYTLLSNVTMIMTLWLHVMKVWHVVF